MHAPLLHAPTGPLPSFKNRKGLVNRVLALSAPRTMPVLRQVGSPSPHQRPSGDVGLVTQRRQTTSEAAAATPPVEPTRPLALDSSSRRCESRNAARWRRPARRGMASPTRRRPPATTTRVMAQLSKTSSSDAPSVRSRCPSARSTRTWTRVAARVTGARARSIAAVPAAVTVAWGSGIAMVVVATAAGAAPATPPA